MGRQATLRCAVLSQAGACVLRGCGHIRPPIDRPLAHRACRELAALLDAAPHLRGRQVRGYRQATDEVVRSSLLEFLLFTALESACMSYLAGAGRCQRCEHGDLPHRYGGVSPPAA